MLVAQQSTEFDLNPDPRILPMLGEIALSQERCLAELIDNSVDGVLNEKRAGRAVDALEVSINVPTRNVSDAKVTIRDNAPGMDADTFEKAMRAGWSGNDPINNLGLFGMGFNIATARLGRVTTVWTTRTEDTEWIGLEIDFAKMARQRHFRTPRLTRQKIDPVEHGTEISIEILKPEQRAWFAVAGNRTKLSKALGRMYSAMLRANGVPVSFRLKLNGTNVPGRDHCIWGDDPATPRRVDTARYGTLDAFQRIDRRLADKLYCVACMQWLGPDDEACPVCGSMDNVQRRERHIHGWLGIQRYLSSSEYGIDLLRNGRKIELANRDLFTWNNGDTVETEYPIDDPRNRGRIVGEIHIDHCRVNYTKDHFERSDLSWEEMVRVIRGEGPLQPDKAAQRGYPKNESPLSLLFQAFRRSSPKPKVAGSYAKLLIVPDNVQAEAMAKRFHAGDAAYQSDAKWWELIEEADDELLVAETTSGSATVGSAGTSGTDQGSAGLVGFGTPSANGGGITASSQAVSGQPGAPAPSVAVPSPSRISIHSLDNEYQDKMTKRAWRVQAYHVEADDPDLPGTNEPWVVKALPNGRFEFLVNTSHEVFQSATMTPLDGLLTQLAWTAIDLRRIETSFTFAGVLASLREDYATRYKLDPVDLAGNARLALKDIARSLPRNIDPGDGDQLFGEFSPAEQQAVYERMVARSELNPQQAIGDGRFLEYAPHGTLLGFFERHPELFFDGRYWDVAYDALNFVSVAATDEARAQQVRDYSRLIVETIWLSDQDAADASTSSRARLQRAALAVDLLSSNVSQGGAS